MLIAAHLEAVVATGAARALEDAANALGYYDDPNVSPRGAGKTRHQCAQEFRHALELARSPEICQHPDVRRALVYAAPQIQQLRL